MPAGRGTVTRKIATSLGVGQSTATEYLKRAERSGLSWPLPDGVTDADLERRLFEPQGGTTRRDSCPRTGRRSIASSGARV